MCKEILMSSEGEILINATYYKIYFKTFLAPYVFIIFWPSIVKKISMLYIKYQEDLREAKGKI